MNTLTSPSDPVVAVHAAHSGAEAAVKVATGGDFPIDGG